MPGRILIVDQIATNRIVLKVKLASAFYQVDQAEDAQTAARLIRQSPPDLILVGWDQPDEDALELCRSLKACERTSQIPVLAIADDAARPHRLRALAAGADDVMSKPLADSVLLARIRSLLRARDSVEELRLRDSAARVLGLAEKPGKFEAPTSLMISTATPEQGLRWRGLLRPMGPFSLRQHPLADVMRNLSKYPVPDGFVIGLSAESPDEGLRLLAELRARAATRQAAVLVVMQDGADQTRIDALDLGANDVMTHGFDPEEAALRLTTLVQRKRLLDRLRQTVHDGLAAAVTDPLTGLHNRRYALPQLARIARQAQAGGRPCAVMVADLDHFKTINDRYGHAAGDVVLAETARRMRETLPAADLIARIGGEEFLVVLQDTDPGAATTLARKLCDAVRRDPVYLQGRDIQIPVTVSIGVALGGTPHQLGVTASDLIDQADRALYGAKADGRDQVTLGLPAA